MNDRSDRLARVRDFALISGGGASLTFGLAFLAARIWFRNWFILTERPDPLGFSLAAFGLAAVLGILHVFLPAPLPRPQAQAYKGEADR